MPQAAKTVPLVVQARMGSSRFPGKMLAVVAGRPLIDHVFLRLKTILGAKAGGLALGPLVLATSDTPENRRMAERLPSIAPEIEIVFGAEDDVLSRFLAVIERTGCEHLVRATGDCPLLNVEDLASKVASHLAAEADVTNYEPGCEYADKGVEVVSARALLETACHPGADSFHREHVTAFLYENPRLFRVHYVAARPFLRRADLRLTVDEPKDAEFYNAFARAIGRDLAELTLAEAIEFLDRHPEIAAINQGAGRKSALIEPGRILYRCDGGVELGMGHVVGCIRFARFAARTLRFGAEFMVRENPEVVSYVRKSGFECVAIPKDSTIERQIAAVRAQRRHTRFSAVLFNFNAATLAEWGDRFEELRAEGLKVLFIDNPTASCRHADLVVNPLPHPDFAGYDPGAHPACFDGLEFLLFDPPMRELIGQERLVRPAVERILVAMGGSDPLDITSRVLRALAEIGCAARIDAVLGPLCPRVESVRRLAGELPLSANVSVDVTDLPSRIQAADAGFSSLGLTTYEMAALGLPCLIIAPSDFNAKVAEIYSRRYGLSVAAGKCGDLSDAQLRALVGDFLGDHDLRRRVALRRRAVFGDGAGLQRVSRSLRKILAPPQP